MRRILSLIRNNTGQSIVEFALMLPFLLAIIGGIVDFSLSFFIGSIAQNSAREGSRVGAVTLPEDVDGDGVPDFGDPTFPAADEGSCTFGADCTCAGAASEILRRAACSIPAVDLFDGFTITSQFIAAGTPNDEIRVTVTGVYNWFLIDIVTAPLPLLGFGPFPASVTVSRTASMRWEWQSLL